MRRPNVLQGVQLTRRGKATVAIVIVAYLFGATAGARSLNAVVVSGLIVLGVGLVQIARAETPTITRSTPPPGFPGETRTVTADVTAPLACRLDDQSGGGIQLTDAGGDIGYRGRIEYLVSLEHRGEHRLGPATWQLRDVFGLFERHVEDDGTSTVLVYPRVFAVTGDPFAAIVRDALEDRRDRFDRLREYAASDSMRDIHWRASARRADREFVVAEYESFRAADQVHIVAESDYWGAHQMAEATASIAGHFQEAGIDVRVTVPDGHCVAPATESGRGDLLKLLARTDHGRIEQATIATADIHVRAVRSSVTVRTPDGQFPFDAVVGDRIDQSRSTTRDTPRTVTA